MTYEKSLKNGFCLVYGRVGSREIRQSKGGRIGAFIKGCWKENYGRFLHPLSWVENEQAKILKERNSS